MPSRAVGYAMVALAATLFAINGTVSKVILGSGIDAAQLTEVRCAGALLGLMLIGLATRPAALPLHRDELPLIVALVGLVMIVEVWQTDRPDAAGLAAAALAAVTYAAYILLAERGVRRRDPISLSAWGFFFATLFWSVLAPWWSFPAGRVDDRVSLLGKLASNHLPVWALVAWMVVLGTIVPFALVVAALQRISATRAAITAMLEPVLAIVIAWLWLGESLDPLQVSGAAVTLAGVSLALSSR